MKTKECECCGAKIEIMSRYERSDTLNDKFYPPRAIPV